MLLLFLLLPVLGAAAAQTPAPAKETVVVDLFTRVHTVPAPYAEVLRAEVVEAFRQRGRHIVVDAATVPQLMASLPGSGITTPEKAPADLSAFLELRAPQIAAREARYLVSGTVAGYKFEHADLPADGKHPSRPGFRASFRVVVAAVDLRLGQRLADETFELTATAPTADEADRAALARIAVPLSFYIDRNFKFETLILQLCPPDRKGRIRELYIHSGSDMGVCEGDLFMVYEEVPIGGVMTRQKVGRLRVNDVQNPDVARCKIAKGDAEIVAAFTAGRGLVCLSDGKAFGY